MFTGIIQDIGTVADIVRGGDWLLKIKPEELSLTNTAIGASIACSGVCLTVVEKSSDMFQVQASAETLDKTTIKHWNPGRRINLEPALRLGDELGGHLVSGHIDGAATVAARSQDNNSLRLQFSAPHEYAHFLAPKGSVTIDGVSLTVNEVEDATFTVNIIPHTQIMTTLGDLVSGDSVNFEVDMLARYTERLLRRQ